MGMDVYGKKPTTEEGKYFRRNVWGWRPLADLILGLCPVEARPCKYWQSNDGDGLNAKGAVKLADALDHHLESGDVAAWVTIRDAELKHLPNERCNLCRGTGVRRDAVGMEMKQPERSIPATTDVEGATMQHPRAGQKGWCNGCDGRGWNRPSATFYGADESDVREFVTFLRGCGGFEIC
jgi:hypothetical protein